MELSELKEIIKKSVEAAGEESILIDLRDEDYKEKKYSKGVKTEMFQLSSGCTMLVDIDNKTNLVVSIEFI